MISKTTILDISYWTFAKYGKKVLFRELAKSAYSRSATSIHKNNGTNDKFYRKVAFLMYTEMFNFRPQS